MSLADLGFSLNALIDQTAGRQPRGAVSINGTYVDWVSWEVDNNNYYMADTFKVTIPTSTLPPLLPVSYFSSTPAILVEIFGGFPPFPNIFNSLGLDSIIVGQVDDITYEPHNALITLSGRDLTAKFIDNKTTEKFQNLTSSQIATLLAQRRGLTPVVTKTTIKSGKYYEIDHVRMTDQKSEWDLLTYLAHEENFDVFVKGQSLYFQPKASTTAVPYVIDYSLPLFSGVPVANFVQMELSRNLNLSKDIIVEVRSWNQKQKKGFTKKATATHNKNTVLAGAAQPVGEAETYSFVYPNLTPEQALQKAQNLLQEFSKHEMKSRIFMPGNNLVMAQSTLKIIGTNTNWDQVYYVDSAIRSMVFEGGYDLRLEVKNHSPVSTVLA